MNPVFAAEADGTLLGFLAERRGELIDFACALVATPSPNPPGDERAVAALVVDKLRALGIGRIDTVGANEARPNVIARVGSTARPALVLCGHLDTKPPGDLSQWRLDPYGASIEDGELYGLGSGDMKGAVAAMVFALSVEKRPLSVMKLTVTPSGAGLPVKVTSSAVMMVEGSAQMTVC